MLLINLQGKDPIYLQIKIQIIRFIEMGVLTKDEKLPSVRQLAEDLAVNPNTVQKAYSELEDEGYIYTLFKKGAFVKGDIDTDPKTALKNDFKNKALEAIKNGLTKQELEAVLKEIN